MGSFQYNEAISGSILNTPLGDARFYEHNGQITLASDGGQGVVTLTAAAKQQPPWPTAPQFLPMRHRKMSPLAGGRSQFQIEI